MSRYFSSVFLMLVLCFGTVPASAQIYQTPAKQAILMDADTGTILFSKDVDERIPPASLAKLMTIEVVFNELKAGRMRLDDKFFVSENAWRTGGAVSGTSTMFAKLGSDIALEDLLKGVIVQSANDGCIVIAEGLAGSEAEFAKIMNSRAKRLGMSKSNFVNSSGLPAEGQFVTLADLIKLSRHIVSEYPEYYSYFSLADFEWNNIKQRNRNPLLKMDIGVDGLKTGFTEASGFAIVTTAVRDGQRLIAGLSGMTSKRQRIEESRKILDWGFRAFERVKLLKEGESIAELSVYGGEKPYVGAVPKGVSEIYLPLANRENIKGRVVYNGPLLPPIAEGEKIAKLQIWLGEDLGQEIDLYAAESVEKGPLDRRAIDAAKELLFGWIRF